MLAEILAIISIGRSLLRVISVYSRASCMCRWSFLQSAEKIRKQEFADVLPRASIQDLGVILMGAGYEVCRSVLAYAFFAKIKSLLGITSLFCVCD